MKLIMLVGIPYSGKSHWVRNYQTSQKDFQWPPKHRVISSDKIITDIAYQYGYTYGEAFKHLADFAMFECSNAARNAIDAGLDVIWDQTNLTRKSRAKKLALFDKLYTKEAVVFPCPSQSIINARREMRPQQNINDQVIGGMRDTFEMPTLDEGFNVIEVVNSF